MHFKGFLNKFKKGSKPIPSILTIYRNKKKRLSRLSIKDLDLLEGKNVSGLLKKYSLSPSKAKTLDKMVVDYRKGNLSLSGSTTSKYKNKKLNKEKLEKIIQNYEEAKRKRRNSLSLRIIDKINDMDVAELKRKFSWSSSKRKLYSQMMESYKDDKFSLSKISNKADFDPKKLSKSKIDELLKDYEEKQKAMKSSSTKIDSLKRSLLSLKKLLKIPT